MDPLEKQLYSDVGVPMSDIKDIEGVFGDDVFLGDDDGLSKSTSAGSGSDTSSSNDLRNLGPGVQNLADISEETKIVRMLEHPNDPKVVESRRETSSRVSILAEIANYRTLLKDRKLPIPDDIARILKSPNKRTTLQLKEARDHLRRQFNNSETSEVITEMQMTFIQIIATIFQGKTNVPFTKFKLNLTGYPQQLRRKMRQITTQNIKIAGIINDRIGEDIVEVFKFFSLYISPLIMVLSINHGTPAMRDMENYDELSDDEDETETGSEEETGAGSESDDNESTDED